VILSDVEIRRAIAAGAIRFDPVLDDDYLDLALTTSALDLRLGNELQFYKPATEIQAEDPPGVIPREIIIDPSHPGVISGLIATWGRRLSIQDSHYDLQPRQFVLGTTLESLSLPHEHMLAARVEGKSTLARLGFVVHMTAPTIHCGFEGNIVLEVYNFGEYPIRLTPGMRVCQLIFERLGEAPSPELIGQYQGQQSAASPARSAEPSPRPRRRPGR
jgi:dCTP deaminase